MTKLIIRRRDSGTNAKVIQRSEAKVKQQAALANLMELQYQFGWNPLRDKHIATLKRVLKA